MYCLDCISWVCEEDGMVMFECDVFFYNVVKRLVVFDVEYEGLVFG